MKLNLTNYFFATVILVVFFSFIPYVKLISQQSNDYSICLNISGLRDKYVYLYNYYGDETKLLDSSIVGKDNSVVFYLSKANPTGLFGIAFGNKNLNLIFNKEDINIKIDTAYPLKYSKVISSIENKIYFQFLNDYDKLNAELYLLSPVIDGLTSDDIFLKEVTKHYNLIQKRFNKKYNYLVKKYPDLYVSKLIKAKREPFEDSKLSNSERLVYLKTHYFDDIYFDDTSLLRSNIYTSKVISYLALYSNNQYQKNELESSFKTAIDSVFAHIDNKNTEVYNFILYYLINGFEKYKFETLVEYLSEKYIIEIKNTCESNVQKSELQKRLEGYKKLAIGKITQDISFVDINNETIKLSEINNDYVLLIFWESSCPYCNELLPEVKKKYDDQELKKFEIIAISVDTVKEDFLKKITVNEYNWINFCDYLGWDGEIVQKYCIYATPTMYLLNKQREIISKPQSIFDLINDIDNLK